MFPFYLASILLSNFEAAFPILHGELVEIPGSKTRVETLFPDVTAPFLGLGLLLLTLELVALIAGAFVLLRRSPTKLFPVWLIIILTPGTLNALKIADLTSSLRNRAPIDLWGGLMPHSTGTVAALIAALASFLAIGWHVFLFVHEIARAGKRYKYLIDHIGAILGVLAAATLVVDVDSNLHRDELQTLDANSKQAASVLYSTFHALETACDRNAKPRPDQFTPSEEFCRWGAAQSYRFYELQFEPDYIRVCIGPLTLDDMTGRPLSDVIEYGLPQSDTKYRALLLNELDAMDKFYCRTRSLLSKSAPLRSCGCAPEADNTWTIALSRNVGRGGSDNCGPLAGLGVSKTHHQVRRVI